MKTTEKHSIIRKWVKKRRIKMRTIFSSTFIKKETLKEADIYHPIKLEYYKIINEDRMIKQEKAKFGIYVVKTEYKKDDVKVENKEIPYLTNDEKRVEQILNMLKENEVTPVSVVDILSDFSKKVILF